MPGSESGDDGAKPVPVGRKLSELPAIFASLPRLSDEEAASLGADIDAAREELARIPVHDPWSSRGDTSA
jgi:hypothetical protein